MLVSVRGRIEDLGMLYTLYGHVRKIIAILVGGFIENFVIAMHASYTVFFGSMASCCLVTFVMAEVNYVSSLPIYVALCSCYYTLHHIFAQERYLYYTILQMWLKI